MHRLLNVTNETAAKMAADRLSKGQQTEAVDDRHARITRCLMDQEIEHNVTMEIHESKADSELEELPPPIEVSALDTDSDSESAELPAAADRSISLGDRFGFRGNSSNKHDIGGDANTNTDRVDHRFRRQKHHRKR